MPAEDRYANVPFDEALGYLRAKINLDTDKWDDVLDAEHDAAFVVAGAKGSLLSELRTAVDRAIANGQRPEEFLKDFERISEGWSHTGSKAWRANIILQTNLTQSYAAGRATYQLDPEVLKVQPYLRWIHGDSARPRPSHLALNGRVFRATELPFYPPNGYGCLCRTISMTQAQVDRQGLEVSDLKAGDPVEVEIDGRIYNPVLGPDKGFDRIPGQGNRRDILAGMIARMPPEIAKPLQDELDRIDREIAKKKAEQKKKSQKSGARNQKAVKQPKLKADKTLEIDPQVSFRADYLEQQRDKLIQQVGIDLVESAEKAVQKIVDESSLFIRVPSSNVIESILSQGRFKSAVELAEEQVAKAVEAYLPEAKGYKSLLDDVLDELEGDDWERRDYALSRLSAEKEQFGIDKSSDSRKRPIYGYWGNNDFSQLHQSTVSRYGNIAVKLKSQTKARATMTGADSWMSGPSSPAGKINAASLANASDHMADLKGWAQLTSHDDVINKQGRGYLEAQIYGGVTPEDIEEIVFNKGETPTQVIKDWAALNKVRLVINE